MVKEIIMKAKIIRSEKLKEEDYGKVKVTDVLSTKELPGFNISIVKKLSTDEKLGYNKESNLVYYVLEGRGKCVLDGKEYIVKKGDFIVSPKGTVYKTLKGLTLLAIASPPFDQKKRVYKLVA